MSVNPIRSQSLFFLSEKYTNSTVYNTIHVFMGGGVDCNLIVEVA